VCVCVCVCVCARAAHCSSSLCYAMVCMCVCTVKCSMSSKACSEVVCVFATVVSVCATHCAALCSLSTPPAGGSPPQPLRWHAYPACACTTLNQGSLRCIWLYCPECMHIHTQTHIPLHARTDACTHIEVHCYAAFAPALHSTADTQSLHGSG
jgi:hypothetical protein